MNLPLESLHLFVLPAEQGPFMDLALAFRAVSWILYLTAQGQIILLLDHQLVDTSCCISTRK
jgi:hypothetical protein